jgi:hypothetical protein
VVCATLSVPAACGGAAATTSTVRPGGRWCSATSAARWAGVRPPAPVKITAVAATDTIVTINNDRRIG